MYQHQPFAPLAPTPTSPTSLFAVQTHKFEHPIAPSDPEINTKQWSTMVSWCFLEVFIDFVYRSQKLPKCSWPKCHQSTYSSKMCINQVDTAGLDFWGCRFLNAVSTVSHVAMGQLSERGAHRWCQDIPVASKLLGRQQSELSGTKLRNQSARFSDLHVGRSVSKSHQSWGEVLGSHRWPATPVRSLGGTRELVTCITRCFWSVRWFVSPVLLRWF